MKNKRYTQARIIEQSDLLYFLLVEKTQSNASQLKKKATSLKIR